MRLTLRTLLAYLDDTLPAAEAKAIGEKVAESTSARELIDRIRKLTRKRSLSAPAEGDPGTPADPNVVSDYLSDTLFADEVTQFEEACLNSDVNLAEVASCHQILTLLMSEPVRVPPMARQRMYQLVKGPESQPHRKPGATMPIGGEPPEGGTVESFDPDATLLLGVPALAGADTGAKRAYPVLIGLGLLTGMLVTGYLAWPRSHAESAAAQPTAPQTKPTVEVRPPQPADEQPKREPKPPPAPDAEKRELAPVPRGAKPDLPQPVEQAPLPAVAAAAGVAEPKTDRLAVGRHVNPAAVLLARRTDEEDAPWLRTTAESVIVHTADRLVAPAGYKAAIELESGIRLDLWGNLPEQLAAPILESSVTVHVPADGFSADLTVHAGRVYLSTNRPLGGRVRLRLPGHLWESRDVWDLTLTDDRAEVVVEVRHPPRRGQNGARPLTAVTVAVLRGSVGIVAGKWEYPKVDAGSEWDADNRGGFVGPRRAGAPETGRLAEYFARSSAPGKEPALVAKALAAFGPTFTGRSGAKVAFAAAVSMPPGDPATSTYLARTAILWQAGVNDVPAVVNALCDTNHRDFRQAAILGLPGILARSPDALDGVVTQLEHARLSKTQAEAVVSLLTGGPKPPDRLNPDELDRLVTRLSSDALPVRELAYWVLTTDIDPTAARNMNLNRYDPAATAEARESYVRAWRARVNELKAK